MYSKDALEACRQVLNDVIYCLRDYADRFYLIGGWAVYYLLDRPDRKRREVAGRTVIVDLLGGKQEVKDSFTFKRRISGATLAGEVIDADISVANLPACLVLKAQAFDENPKDKDAYDLYYLVAHGGAEDADTAFEVKKVLKHPFVAEGVKVLHVHFGKVEGKGLRAATQMLSRFEGRPAKVARAMVRGNFSRFFKEIGMAVNF